jgi:hypothetical protein
MVREAFMVGLDPRYSQMGRLFGAIASTLTPLLIILSLTGAFVWLQATNEAAAFNRLTDGPKVTTWDAVLLELRVEACR